MIDYINFMLFHPHVFIIGTYVATVAVLVILIWFLFDARQERRRRF